MNVFAGVLLLLGMYLVLPIVVCLITIAILGGSERLLPGPMRDRAVARREQSHDGH